MNPMNRAFMILWPVLLMALSGCRSTWSETANPTMAGEVTPDSTAPLSAVTNTVLDVHSAITAALAHQPEIVLLRQAMEVARAEAVTCSGLLNPELRVGYDVGGQRTERTWYTNTAYNVIPPYTNTAWRPLDARGDDARDQDTLQLALRIFPPNPWLLWAQGDGARARFAAASADLRAAEWRLLCGVRKLFNTLDYLEQDLELAGKLVAIRQAEAETLRILADKQQVTAVDELAAVQRHYQVLMDRERMEASLAQKRAELSAMTGIPVAGVLQDPPAAREAGLRALGGDRLAAMRVKVIENRQEVVAAYWRQQSAQASLREAKSLRIPWFTHIQGSYTRGRSHEALSAAANLQTVPGAIPDPVLATDESQDESWGIEAAVEIPVFSLGPGATRLQRADCRRWTAVFGETTRNVLTQFDGAVTAWQDASRRSARLETDSGALIKRAEDLAAEITARRDLAPGDTGKVQETILQMKRTVLQSHFERQQAWLLLEEAFGASLKAVEMRAEIR